jgi:type I restriction enzyme S subunit
LTSRANTTVQTTINLKDLKALPIPIPPLAERIRIADIIYAIDDRIALLRETNATLEAIAQALFKSWFVDFDPVLAKQEGRVPEGMDAETAALFPDGFEESELGLVPKGWTVGCVGNFAHQSNVSVNPLLSPTRLYEHYSLPAYDNNQTPVLEFGETIRSNKTIMPPDVVLLSKLNPHIPRVWLPVQVRENAVCSTEFLAYVPSTQESSKEFIYCYFRDSKFLTQLRQLVTGTSNSHQRVKADQIPQLKAVVPSQKVLSAFADVSRPISEKVHVIRNQSLILAALRDTLLPRLISGQLRLPEAEEQFNEALTGT